MRDFDRKKLLNEKVSARLDALQKRAKAISVSPPIPVSFQLDTIPESGVVGKYIVAADGIVTGVCAYVGELEKDSNVSVIIQRDSENLGDSHTFQIKKGLFSVSGLEFPIYAGDRLTMTISDFSKVSNVWISFLYEIALNRGAHEYFLIENLLGEVKEL